MFAIKICRHLAAGSQVAAPLDLGAIVCAPKMMNELVGPTGEEARTTGSSPGCWPKPGRKHNALGRAHYLVDGRASHLFG